MSEQKSTLEAILAQYEKNAAPKYEKTEAKVYDLKNYFTTYLEKGVKSGTKTIRILPTSDGKSPFVEMHAHKVLVDGEWKTYPCLKHEKNEPCPFCEAYDALRATGKDSDKELAKKFNSRLMYIVKIIDRDNEDEGVKFWRFNHDFRKEGVYDKIFSAWSALKKDITDKETGRDLVITLNRNMNDVPVVSGIQALDASPLSEDSEKAELWLSDTRVWQDVYAIKNYDFLELIVKGETPVWSKDENKFVAKNSAKTEEAMNLEAELTIGVENVKSTLKAATPVPQEVPSSEDEEDDLPF